MCSCSCCGDNDGASAEEVFSGAGTGDVFCAGAGGDGNDCEGSFDNPFFDLLVALESRRSRAAEAPDILRLLTCFGGWEEEDDDTSGEATWDAAVAVAIDSAPVEDGSEF